MSKTILRMMLPQAFEVHIFQRFNILDMWTVTLNIKVK